MNLRFPLAALQPGMELAVGICHDGGVLLPAGAKVTERHLKQLSSWGITEVEPETPVHSLAELVKGGAALLPAQLGQAPAQSGGWKPPGHDSPDGRTFRVTESITWIEGVVTLDKPTIIQGSIGAHVRIEAASDLQVDGDVGTGVRIRAGRDLAVRGEILGTAERPVILEAERMSLHGARFATMSARGLVTAVDLIRCQVKAGTEISVSGHERGVVASELEAGERIRCGLAGGEEDKAAVLRVTQARQKQLYQVIVSIERSVSEAAAEMGRLEKVIEVIRILGEKVVTLPAEKKQELAAQSKRYIELKAEVSSLEAKRIKALEEIERDIADISECPIQIQKLLPGIEVIVGPASLHLMARQNATGYTVKNGRIRALSAI